MHHNILTKVGALFQTTLRAVTINLFLVGSIAAQSFTFMTEQTAGIGSGTDRSYQISLAGEGLPQAEGPVNMLGHFDIPGESTADVWGYVDTTTGKEYALVGYGLFTDPPNAGLFIVDVTNPANPLQVANVNTVPGFDVKVWRHYVYTVNGTAGSGGIVDISNPENPQVVGSFPSSHNIFIDENGYMYLECPGLQIFDLNPDPTNPTFVWSDATQNCHDAAVIGNRLYDFHGRAGTNIYDVTDPAKPQLLGAINDTSIVYHHSGWVTEDGQYLFICDEGATHPTADITVWDIGDVGNPQKVGEFADSAATIHNLYIVGDYAYTSYYTAGFRVLDVSDPTHPTLVGEFDTAPASSGEGFVGAFGAYPFTPSGNIYVSDIENGLYIFCFDSRTTEVITNSSDLSSQLALHENYPNPFNPTTTISYQLPRNTHVQLVLYNTLGQPIRTLINAFQYTGAHRVTWDGKDDTQKQVAAGVYFYRLQAEGFTETRRLILLR